ncbi:MAG: DUF4406 domain-containing protein [Candidatus Paceibacterota bacterium]|jgi:hypothetical protein
MNQKEKKMKKVVFVAHPISGDVAGNVKKVLAICAEIHRGGNIPVVPYIVSLQYLDDTIIEERRLGIDANLICFHKHFIDELWLFGNRISEGMKEEVILAIALGIPIVAKTPETQKALDELVKKL